MAGFMNRILITISAFVVLALASALYVAACPFCSAINLTFTDQIKSNDIVVIAKLLEIAKPIDDPDAEMPKSKFEISKVIKGKEFADVGSKFRSLLVGKYPLGQEFLVMGVDPPNVAWSTPMKASQRVVGYLDKIQKLPDDGVKRLEFFQKYFEDKESVLAFDAYDEFAKAPYEDIIKLKDKMDREQLVGWIKDPETSINRRRLYLTMLGVCGTSQDIKMLEKFIKSGDRKQQAGLDALIACYLTLNGDKGVQLIEDTFLRDKSVEYVDTLAAVSALRFHGTETNKVDKKRIVAAIRLLLDRPKMADMIIPDLARWEDWSVMEKLVQMFKDANEETNWLRVPVISYLRECPNPKAKEYIEELRKIDPDAIRRADFFLDFEDDEDDEDDEPSSESDPGAEGGQDQSGGEEKEHPVSTVANVSYDDNPDGEKSTHTVRRIPIAGSNDATPETLNDNLVNSTASSTVKESGNVESRSESNEVALARKPSTTTPVAAAATAGMPTWQIIFVPMMFSIAIFVLLWSVINGWFETTDFLIEISPSACPPMAIASYLNFKRASHGIGQSK